MKPSTSSLPPTAFATLQGIDAARKYLFFIVKDVDRSLNFLQTLNDCHFDDRVKARKFGNDPTFFHKLNFENLDQQLPLHAVVHKLSDFIVQSEMGDTTAAQVVNKTLSLEREHPDILMFDPIGAVRILCNRSEQYSLMKFVCSEGRTKSPPFVELKKMDQSEMLRCLKRNGVSFPFVCKPIVAHAAENAHKMQLVFGPHGLADIEMPCVAQQFVAHDGILYKVFVIGDDLFVSLRPSLKNFSPGDFPTLAFKTQEVSKLGSCSALSPRQEEFSRNGGASSLADLPKELVQMIRKKTGMSLFGVDLIVEQGTNQVYVIDVNSFPSYNCVPDFADSLCRFLLSSLEKSKAHKPREPPPAAVDSGLGSSAESDDTSDCEKKLAKLLRNHPVAEPNRQGLKKYYGIPKIFHHQLCLPNALAEKTRAEEGQK